MSALFALIAGVAAAKFAPPLTDTEAYVGMAVILVECTILGVGTILVARRSQRKDRR